MTIIVIELYPDEADELRLIVADKMTQLGELSDKTSNENIAEAYENRRFRLKDILEKLNP